MVLKHLQTDSTLIDDVSVDFLLSRQTRLTASGRTRRLPALLICSHPFNWSELF